MIGLLQFWTRVSHWRWCGEFWEGKIPTTSSQDKKNKNVKNYTNSQAKQGKSITRPHVNKLSVAIAEGEKNRENHGVMKIIEKDS